jgi:hypothetical protein
MKNLGKIAGLLGLAFLGSKIFGSIREEAVAEGMTKARDELFDVSPGCTAITFKGGTAVPDPDALQLADSYYFVPFVKKTLAMSAQEEAEIHDMSLLDFVTAKVLYNLFPECVASTPWPPKSILGAGTFGGIWIGMKAYIGGVLTRIEEGDA